MERRAATQAEQDGQEYVPVTERGAQNHAIRQRRDLLSELRQRAEKAREAYAQAREQDAGRVQAAVEAARVLFRAPGGSGFAQGFDDVLREREEARQRALEEERERERLRQLEAERVQFVEDTARAWQDSREMKDTNQAKERQDALVRRVDEASERYRVSFDDLADPINARADEIKAEREQQRELEREQQRQVHSRDYGLEL